MNNREKLMSRSSKLKVHRAYSQTISSYPVRSVTFSMDIIFSSSVSLLFVLQLLWLLLFFCFVLKSKIYILIHIRLFGRGSDKKNSTSQFPEAKLLFLQALNILSEYTYFYISKNITSYTFLHVCKIVESLQCIPKKGKMYQIN